MTQHNPRTNAQFTTDLLNDPYFIGFENLVNKMTLPMQGKQNYPPYNIIRKSDNSYELQLAVAGFSFEQLDIEVKDGILSILGEKNIDREDSNQYLHKGISARSFTRTFTLSDTIVVNNADLNNGILSIDLENVIPDEKKPRKINITRPTEK